MRVDLVRVVLAQELLLGGQVRRDEPALLQVVVARVLDELLSDELSLSRVVVAHVPDGVDLLMLAQVLGQVLLVAGQDVDHTSWHVRSVQDFVQIERRNGRLLVGHHDNGVAMGDGAHHVHDEREQGRVVVGVVAADDSDAADGLVEFAREAVLGRVLELLLAKTL